MTPESDYAEWNRNVLNESDIDVQALLSQQRSYYQDGVWPWP